MKKQDESNDGFKMDDITNVNPNELTKENYKKSVQGKIQPFKQAKGHGCGGFALANLFNDGRFIQELREDGDNVGTLNKLLSKYKSEYYLTTLILMQTHSLHDRVTDAKIFETDAPHEYAKPYLMIVFFPAQKNFHYTTVLQNYKDGLFYVCDSRLTHVQKFKAEDMLEFYWVIGFEHFCRWDRSVNDEICFSKEVLQHLIPWGD